MRYLPKTDLYALTDSSISLGRSNVELVQEFLRAGIRIIQYREKNKSFQEMLAQCREIRKMTTAAGCCFIVNDHVELAVECMADGVHVGQDDLPLAEVRKLVGEECIIGVSARTGYEAEVAAKSGADYLGVGAVFPTNTKKDAVHTGLLVLQEIAENSPIPIVAIGGIHEGNIQILANMGIQYFAVVSALTLATDISAQVALLRSKILLPRA